MVAIGAAHVAALDGAHAAARADRAAQAGGHLFGQGLHTFGGHGGMALGEHFEDEIKFAGRAVELFFQENAPEKGLEEMLGKTAEALLFEGLAGGHFLLGENLGDALAAQAAAQAQGGPFLGPGADGREQAAEGKRQMPRGIAEGIEPALVHQQAAGEEVAQLEGLVIEDALGFGISGQQHLEAAIEGEAFEHFALDAPADAFLGFQNLDAVPKGFEFEGGAQAAEARTDDANIHM